MHHQKTLQFLQILQITGKMICEKRARVPSYKDKINPSHLNIRSFYTQTAIWRYQKTAEIVEKVENPPHKCLEKGVLGNHGKPLDICNSDSDILDSRWLCYNL